jgi:hypothetical protein
MSSHDSSRLVVIATKSALSIVDAAKRPTTE